LLGDTCHSRGCTCHERALECGSAHPGRRSCGASQLTKHFFSFSLIFEQWTKKHKIEDLRAELKMKPFISLDSDVGV